VRGDAGGLEVKALFLAASAAFAALPGVAVLVSGLGTPPGSGNKWLFGGVIEAFGALAIIILWLNQNKLRRIAKRRVTRFAILLTAFCFALIVCYVLLFRHTVVEHPRGTAYYPLWLSGDVSRMVERAGSREAAIERYGIGGVREAIDRMGGFPLALTSVLLLLVYQGIFTSLAVAFGLAGFHMSQPLLDDAANVRPPPPPRTPAG
jgi:hypothetical protein